MAHYTISREFAAGAVAIHFSANTALRDLVFLKQHLEDSPFIQAVNILLDQSVDLPIIIEVETEYNSEVLKTVRRMCAKWHIEEIDQREAK